MENAPNNLSGTMLEENIAKVCHEANKAYCESILDYSQVNWDDAPDWQKQSAINGVKFHLENPCSKPCDSHNNWMKEKLEQGWVYGEVKDPENKTHPCIVDYRDLPFEQQIKDRLFIAIVRTLDVGPFYVKEKNENILSDDFTFSTFDYLVKQFKEDIACNRCSNMFYKDGLKITVSVEKGKEGE